MTKKTVKKSAKKSKVVETPPAKGTKLVARKHAKPKKPAAKVESSGAGHPMLGKPLPAFELPARDGSSVRSKELAGTVVLYFYPKADTPGCTVEACGFRDAIAGYKKLGVPVYGISPDPVASVKKFAEKFKLTFPLLADENHAVCEKFGVWVQKSMYGKTYWGASRTTFIVKDGRIVHVFDKVKPEGHDAEVLAWLQRNA